MIIKKGKTNWMYIAVVALSAVVTGAWLIAYINDNAGSGVVVAENIQNSR